MKYDKVEKLFDYRVGVDMKELYSDLLFNQNISDDNSSSNMAIVGELFINAMQKLIKNHEEKA